MCILLGKSYHFAEMQSVYFKAPADWAKGKYYPSAEMYSVYSKNPAVWSKGKSYSSAEMHSVYSTTQPFGPSGSLTPLQRCTRCTLQPAGPKRSSNIQELE